MNICVTRTNSPKERPASETLGFGKYFSDHMFLMDYTEGQGWHDARIVPYGPLALDPAAMVLHYGQAVFEGMKAYRANDGRLLLFRARQNFCRLNRSDDRICIPYLDEDSALEALEALLRVDGDWTPTAPGTSLYIRPFVIATEPHVGVRPSARYQFIIIFSPVGSYYPQGIKPIKILIEDEYVRAVRGGIGFTKAAANYAISLKGQEKAKELGYAQVLWLDGIERKYIEEIGTTNAFFVIDNTLITPELTGSILPGITRDSVMTLAKSWGVDVQERRISAEELYEAHAAGRLSEAFASGTAAVISPIGEFSWAGKVITLSGGEIGPLAGRLYDTLTGIQYGRLDDPFGWVTEIK